ncbi:unnamed protein product (macronuclear) [Paramecium tetraurelia]|uniref:Uncharacterized protein n=1 Tax=Paramecium tetraurelia TaxID=5888 RepID=A0DFZ2_PARTE|nr:uncharacterized protein GSPATT00002087001 [Paramecium tetraurelia]CAK81959.1 unnamed protein product [Paramecium tetraurelia]|eukprot:XP_001449356.1 hypothetical protein (macronuclear) [Paramecium tetraurelia strain d4-2]
MNNTILLIVLIAFSFAQEDTPGLTAPMQLEVETNDNHDIPEENSGIFQVNEFKSGMGPMDQFFLKDLFETINAAFDDLTDNPNDSTFLQDNQQTKKMQELDESGAIQFQSPLIGFFNPLFSIFTTEGDSDFVEIETISVNGQTQTKVTKTSTRNGITTTTTEITTEASIPELNQEQENKLSDEFQLFESPMTYDVQNTTEAVEQQDQTEQVTQVNLDNLDSIQELHVIQDNYVKNDQHLNSVPQAEDNFALGVTIMCGLTLAGLIGFSIKKCAFKSN